ncbi:MAG: ATP-binding domain-containing protein, partial [Sneathiellales bacterium]|nr:ATP-binding domain-containing protein [Sneathiellales bacterium]
EDNEGEQITLKGLWDGNNEARWVADEIENHQRKGTSLKDIAILVRASFQTRAFEECFISMGIRYRVVGGLRFYERKEIRDVLAYLRVINQANDDLAFERIYNLPKRGLGAKALDNLRAIGREQGLSLSRSVDFAAENSFFKGKAAAGLSELAENFKNWRDQKDFISPDELVEAVLEDSGYLQMWKQDKSTEAEGKVENLKELVKALAEYDSLGEFLEHVALVMENNEDNSADMVSIMTLHSAKGLEYDTVFLPGWEEGLFPHQRALDENGLKALEEERRLAYVGITRAKKKCYISHASNRTIHGQWQSALPSRFIDELPPQHIAEDSEHGVYARERQTQETNISWRTNTASQLSHILEKRAAQNRTFVDNSTKAVNDGETGLEVGDRVFHQKFGYGRILKKDGSKMEVAFDKAGLKKVMENFVDPA